MSARRIGLVVGALVTALTIGACAHVPIGTTERRGGAGNSDKFASIIPAGDIVAASKDLVAASLGGREGFTPPSTGPRSQQPDAKIAFVGSDLTNGGINAVVKGFKEAGAEIGWTVNVYDGKATAQGRSDAMQQAIASNPAAIVLGGFDPTEQSAVIRQANDARIPVLGWHAGPDPGPSNGLFTNITTDPLAVAQLAASQVVADSNGRAGVAIFTDGQYEIAVLKANGMRAYIEACATCRVLDYQDSPIAESDQRMPGIISNLLQQYGDDLTYLMAINGNYFGGAQQALRAANVDSADPPYAVAAGDGDAAEFQRIRNRDYQSATVAEPLLLQGWQLIDEINRALAAEGPSDFVAAPGLITAANVPSGDVFEPKSDYRKVYRSVWAK